VGVGRLTFLLLLGFAVTPGESRVSAAEERRDVAPMIYAHAQACPVPPVNVILVACVCDHEGKNCRPVVEKDIASRTGPGPWCQCAVREMRDGR
jgi:hypothetical protein